MNYENKKINIPLPVKIFFLVGFIASFVGGLSGIAYSLLQLKEILSISNRKEAIIAHVVNVVSRGRSSEDSIYFKLINDDRKFRVNIAKLFDLNIRKGDTIHVIFDEKDKYFIVIEYVNKLIITNILRIMIFIVCLYISFLLFKGFKSLCLITNIKKE